MDTVIDWDTYTPREWCDPACGSAVSLPCYCGGAERLKAATDAGEVDVEVWLATGEAVAVGFYEPDERARLLNTSLHCRLASTGRKIEALPPAE